MIEIASAVRKAVGLRPGTHFHLRLEEGKIILEPIDTSPFDTLYSKYPDADFLTQLEAEHKQEIIEKLKRK